MKTRILLSLLALLAAVSARAGVITWTNTSGGNWSAGTNWNSSTVPGATDDVWITNAGTYTVTQDVPVAIASLTLGGASGTQMLTNAGATLTLNSNGVVNPHGVLAFAGALNGSGSLAVSGTFNWTAGNLRVPMSVTTNGLLELTSSADKGLTGALTNFGTITLTGAGRLLFDPTFIDNRPGALLDLQSDASLVLYSGAPYVTNAGTIRKSSGTGTNVFDGVPLRNTGTVEVQTGAIYYSASGCLFGSGTQFKGAGTNVLGAGTITLDGLISSENLVLGGAVIIGTNTLTGTVQWTSGAIGESGVVTIATNGTLLLTGPAEKIIVGVLNNRGTVQFAGSGQIAMGTISVTATINNEAGARFDMVNDAPVKWTGYSQPFFTNAGTVRKTAGTATSLFDLVIFRNTGVVEAQTGTIAFNATGTQFDTGTEFLGAGTNLLAGNHITLNGAIFSDNLVLGGAVIQGTNTLSGTVRWTGGTIGESGVVTVATYGTLLLTGSAEKAIVGVLNNRGTVQFAGSGQIAMGSISVTATINNEADALFDMLNDAPVNFTAYGQPFFTNAGTVRKSAGIGTTVFSGVVFRNTGIVEAQTGTISFNATGTQFDTGTRFLGAGTNLLPWNHQITLNGAIFSDNLVLGGAVIQGTNTLSGTVRWTGGPIGESGAVTIAASGTLLLTGPAEKIIVGVLNNRGTVQFAGSGQIAMGTISVTATINNEAGALFDMVNDAPVKWTGYSQPFFTNAGTVRKSAGTATSLFDLVIFRNSGIVEAQTGTIAFNATGTQFDTGTEFLGTGTNLLAGNHITLNGAIFSDNLVLGGAVIQGTNTLSGTVRWTVANIGESGVVTIATNGTLLLTGPLQKGLVGVLNNRGTIQFAGSGQLAMASVSVTATINNEAGALFDISNDAPVVWTSHAQPFFTNAGTFRKSGATNLTDVIGVAFINTGTVDVQSGTVRFLSAYTQTGGRLQFGLSSLTNFGQVQFAQTAPLTGTLGVNLLGGFRPKAGDTFAVVGYYPAYTGSFSAFDLSPAAAWETNSSIYGANAVTLTVLNARPTLNPIPPQTGDEEAAITFTATASDPDPGQTWAFGLIDAPSGATIDTNTGVFSWTPTEAQGPSTNTFAVQVTDNGTPNLTGTQRVTVVVHEVNLAPALTVPPTQTLDELTALSATNLATDADMPANTLRFSLVAPPPGVNLDTNTGVLTWTPTEAQGPGTNTITIAVTDNGTPALGMTNSFTVVDSLKPFSKSHMV